MRTRTDVLWVGETLPADFRDTVSALGLRLQSLRHDEVDPEQQNPHCVVLALTPRNIEKFRGRLARILVPTLDSGALLLIVAENASQFETASNLVTERARAED